MSGVRIPHRPPSVPLLHPLPSPGIPCFSPEALLLKPIEIAPSHLLTSPGGVAKAMPRRELIIRVIGIILLALGGIWFLQGVNVLPGSFMTGSPRWAVIGGVMGTVGLVLM